MSGWFTAGRIITALFFILAGINKLTGYSQTLEAMSAVGLPLPSLLLPCVIALEIGAGIVILVGRGRRIVFLAATALALFTLATNAVFHRFWTLEEPFRTLELSLFFKNLVVFAALLMTAGLARSPTKKPA